MPTSKVIKASLQHNKELATLFHQMAACYRYLGPEERFRAIAYETASRTLSNMQEPVDVLADDFKKLDELKGVGESIAQKIIEYLKTGRISTFGKLQKKVPFPLLELMEIEGFGPATVKLLHEKIGINSKDELIEAINNGKLKGIKGIAEKKLENMCRALKLESTKTRIPLKEAEQTANELLKIIENIPGVKRITVAGSLRRKKETIGDIDILLIAENHLRKKIINKIISLPQVENIIAAGQTKASVQLKIKHIQVDIRIVTEDEYGAALLYLTGSKEHNIQLRLIAKKKGWKINEYGVFNVKTGKKIGGRTEEEIYNLFGLNYIPPEKRLGKDEIEKAQKQLSLKK